MDIKFDKHSLIIDGKRVFLKSGAFHYFRSPGEELAKDRFLKLKAGGYNAVDIYFHWQYHSKAQGEYDFSNIKDVSKVLQAAKDVGLFVIARPGPFINGEVNAGGLPLWLLENKNVIPRNKIGSQYHYSPEYMRFLAEWYDVIIPIINKFDNVVLFQIENEYATDEMDEQYMRELYKMARDRGVKCPIFHNDAYFSGLWADVVDIYACDFYPYINPNQNWRKDNFCFDALDNVEDICRSCKEDAPPFIAEMQAGWFDKWDGSGYEHIRKVLSDEHINIMTKTAISQGVTLFNHYMACGGTSWDNLACDEVYTSYDFTAPIDEYGKLEPNYFKAKEINYFLNAFDLTNTDALDYDFYEENIYAKLRQDNENDCQWLFLRNFTEEDKKLNLTDGNYAFLKPYDMKICARNLKLLACEIEFSDTEIFTRLKNNDHEYVFFLSGNGSHIKVKGRNTLISSDKANYDRLIFKKDEKTTEFVFINKSLADKTWVIDDKIIFNADMMYSNGILGLKETSEVAYFDIKNGFSKKTYKTQLQNHTLELKKHDVVFCANEIDCECDISGWRKVKGETDSLSCKAYDEFIWYKAQLPDNINEISLLAHHLFAVYINGKEVLSRNSYKIEKLQQIPETIQIPLNKKILNKKENELTILVENLGFDKGFSGDTNFPRGLVTFVTEPQIDIEFAVDEKLSIQKGVVKESDSPYLARISSEFDVEFQENITFSKYLYLKNFPYRRATIFLNGYKIGRYIKRANVQNKFYLINTFLKEHNRLDIVVWQREKNIPTIWDFKNEAKNVILEVGDEYIYQLFR
ncbi:MAG: beta-galactosidase [Candidatus Gastranaerophilaceae bacterium]